MASNSPRTISASEVGSFLYCRRAWWLQREGWEPSNQDELRTGQEIHDRHGRAVLSLIFLRILASLLLLTALVLAVIYSLNFIL